jgi:hypothetical protein
VQSLEPHAMPPFLGSRKGQSPARKARQASATCGVEGRRSAVGGESLRRGLGRTWWWRRRRWVRYVDAAPTGIGGRVSDVRC